MRRSSSLDDAQPDGAAAITAAAGPKPQSLPAGLSPLYVPPVVRNVEPHSLLVVRPAPRRAVAHSLPVASYLPAANTAMPAPPPSVSPAIAASVSPLRQQIGLAIGAAAPAGAVPARGFSPRAHTASTPHVVLSSSLSTMSTSRFENGRSVQVLSSTPPAKAALHLGQGSPLSSRSAAAASALSDPTSPYLPDAPSPHFPLSDSPARLPPTIALSSISTPSLPSWREELRSLWKLTWPVSAAILFRIGMLLTDLAMLGHKNTDWLAAAAAATIWMNTMSAMLYRAFAGSLNTLCSQAFGAGNFKLCGIWLQQGLLFSSIATIVVGISWWFTGDMLKVMLIEADTAELAGTFAKWSLLWLWPQVTMEVLQRYFQSQHVILPALVLNAIFLFVNAGLNLLFLFGIPAGWWPRALGAELHVNGWDGLGFKGSPISTAISRWLMLFFYWLYCFAYRRYHAKTFLGWSLNRREALQPARVKQYLLHQVLPSAIGICLEEWQLEIIAVFATKLGNTQIATHNATLEVFFFLTSVMFGLVTATQIRIGHYLGAANAPAAKQVGSLALKISAGIGVVVGGLWIIFRADIGRIYSSDPAIWDEAEKISVMVGACYAALSIFYTAMAILNGQARPTIVAIAYLIGCWLICLPVSYVLAFVADKGLFGLWLGLICGYGVVTVIVGVAAYRSDWPKCVEDALARAESRKAKAEAEAAAALAAEEADETASSQANKEQRRKKRQGKKSKSKRQRDDVSTSHVVRVPVVGAGDSINQRSTQLAHNEPSSDDQGDTIFRDSDGDDDGSDLSSSASSREEAWNEEEVVYRERQLAAARKAALMAAIGSTKPAAAEPLMQASRHSSSSSMRLTRSHSSPVPQQARALTQVTLDQRAEDGAYHAVRDAAPNR